MTPDSLEPPAKAEAEMSIVELKLLEPESITKEGVLTDYDAASPKSGGGPVSKWSRMETQP